MEHLTLTDEVINPLSPEIIEKQATINIGLIGHVSHGKTTVVRAISGVNTIRYRSEQERNITIKLGYANAKIYKCSNPECPRPGCYQARGSSEKNEIDCPREGCNHKMGLQRHVSFVDGPGHHIFMATMINGAAVMDAALLLIAANKSCPQPQTSEHLAAVEVMGLKNIIILQNKIDLTTRKEAQTQYNQILSFKKGTIADKAPIIPISAQFRCGIDVVCEYVCNKIPVPIRDFTSSPRLIIIRSFDINKPGTTVENLKGGIAGGSIMRGMIRKGQDVEIKPGIIIKTEGGKIRCMPIITKITTLYAENNELEYAVPGGLIGVGTNIDPTLCRSDRLVGQLLGNVGCLPPVYIGLEITFTLMRRLIGVKNGVYISPLNKSETLMLNIGSTTVGSRVTAIKNDLARLSLISPVCTNIGERIAISRRIDRGWRLIGWGKILGGSKVED